MTPAPDLSPLLAHVCACTGATTATRLDRIQVLWQGYGEVFRVALTDGPVPTVVVKWVRPPPAAHPRKLRSYEVEAHWYTHFAQRLPPEAPGAACWGTYVDAHQRIIVLDDLHAKGRTRGPYRLPRHQRRQVLAWLAAFHATHYGVPPTGLWPIGTYWHLGTRQAELRAMTDHRLRAEAPALDAALNQSPHQTLVHGDAKPSNFLFSAECAATAVDFQYVGGGVGVKDVAYFLYEDVTGSDYDADVNYYFDRLRYFLPTHVDAASIERDWRSLLPIAERDFRRFLNGWQA